MIRAVEAPASVTLSLVAEYAGSAYSASKHGLIGLMRSVAQDAGKHGVTSNAVLPGWVRTEMAERSARAEAAARGITPEQVWEERAALYPAGRVATAQEVAEMIAFLASEESSGVSGRDPASRSVARPPSLLGASRRRARCSGRTLILAADILSRGASMLERIMDLPDHVLGFKASGRVTAEDYESMLVPAVETALSHHKRVRLLYVLGDGFEGFTGAAAWEDAKVGLRHFTRFERVAVVTSVVWVRNSVKAFGFMMPGDVRVFESDDIQKAREWISEPPPAGDLVVEFLDEQGVLILRPLGELTAADFERVSRAVDPYLEKKGALEGVMIVAEHFPGWDDLGALAAHVRFVRDHHQKVKRLAIVSNDPIMSAMPYLARHFLVKESRRFPFDQRDQALAWVSQE